MKIFAVVYFVIGCIAILGTVPQFEVRCRTFTRCELVKELIGKGFLNSSLPNWVCLIEAESGRQTDLVSERNWDGSHDYGIFQINNRYWCASRKIPGKDCSVRCQDLISSDISMATDCAKKIYKQNGYGAWNGWLHKCKGKSLPSIDNCF